MSKKKFNFIDLFSGCGGFSAGLEQAGHKCVLGVDFNQDAIDTFAKNHPHAQAVCTDIHKLSKKKIEKLINLEKVDMVVGGPPCQGFSTVGAGKVEDERNSLFKQFLRIVKLAEPKVILFENVTGILANKNRFVLESIFKSFEKLGYQMSAEVLSADDFNVPSRRKRTIIMGVKGAEPCFPVTAEKLNKITVKQAFKKLKSSSGKIYNHDVDKAGIANTLDKKRLKHIPAGCGIRYERDELEHLPKKLRYEVDWSEISEGRFRQTRLQRLPLDKPAPTILTSRSMYYHPTECRYLTPREAAKCQSFSNDFIFEGSITSQFRQIGNAVPPELARHIGEAIKQIKFNLKTIKPRRIDHNKMRKSAFTYRRSKYA